MLTSLFVNPVNKLGLNFDITDKPDLRKNNNKSIVRIGGLAIFLGLITSTLLFSLIGWLDIFGNNVIIFSLLYTLCVFLIGFKDDINSLSPFIRLVFQIIISFGIWNNLIKIEKLDLSLLSPYLGTYNLSSTLSLVITVLIIVSMINSYNWQDGLDGLAAGGAILSTLGFSFIILGLKSTNSELFYLWIFLEPV